MVILISLLKAHGINRVVASPGATNARLVLALQSDAYFKIYSAVDERHAAYIACGIAEETGSPVMISCTGATASRNYMSALTEAYYRKLPILAVTSSQPFLHKGNMWPQMTDRTAPPPDVVRASFQCRVPSSIEEELDCQLRINQAILELSRHGGGPVHINLERGSNAYTASTDVLPVRMMSRYMAWSEKLPPLAADMKIIIWIGSHRPFTNAEQVAIETFVESHDAVVLVDCTSNYFGKGAISSARLCHQNLFENPDYLDLKPDLVIHIGEISGDYYTTDRLREIAPVWRVSEDGELRQLLGGLVAVFEMPECVFFQKYAGIVNGLSSYCKRWQQIACQIHSEEHDLPFSNLWIASQLYNRIKENAEVHLGILNSLRSWNYFESRECIAFSNVGGFGIDGCVSSLIGASLSDPEKLYYGVVGDLAFFYDLNSIGNRHSGCNVRILIVNNGEGVEFSLPGAIGCKVCDDVTEYVAACRHFGNKSRKFVRHMAEDMGFEYYSADSKESFAKVMPKFIVDKHDKPIVLECFVNSEDDVLALSMINSSPAFAFSPSKSVGQVVRKFIPESIKRAIREVVR